MARRLKRMTASQHARLKKKIDLLDTEYQTVTGETRTVRDLQERMKKANRKLMKSQSYLSSKVYKNVQDRFEMSLAVTGAFKDNTKRYSVSALKYTTPSKLRMVDASVTKAIDSAYLTKTKYEDIDKKRYQKYLEEGYISNREEYDLMIELFSSEAWREMQELGIMTSDQLITMFQDEVFTRGGTGDMAKANIREVFTKYQEALKYSEWANKVPDKYFPSGNVPMKEASNDWDVLVKEADTISEWDLLSAEQHEIASIRKRGDFFRRLRDDLIEAIGG